MDPLIAFSHCRPWVGKLYKTLPRDKQRRMKAKAAKAKVEMVIHYQDTRGIWRVCGAEG